MGLFNKILSGQGSENTPLSPQEAFASVLLVTVAADGHISDEEAASFNAAASRMSLFRSQSGDAFSAMIDKLFGLLRKHGPHNLLSRATASLPPELRQTAFAVAADLVFADGSVEDDEKALLEDLQQALRVPDDLAMKIVEVMVLKNRG